MTNFKRRLVSTALAVTMAVTLLPLPATAADAQKDISIGWNAQEPQTTMEQVTVDLTASLSDASAIESADVYIELTDNEFAALDQSSLEANSDVKLVNKLPAEDAPDDTEEPDAGETDENQPGGDGSNEESGNQDQDQGQGQQPSEPNPDDSQGTETPPESTEGNKEPDSEDAETEGDSSGDSDNTGVPTTPEDSTIPEDPEPSQDPTESPAAEESAMAAVSASAGEDLSILRESPRGVSAASLTRDGDVGGASGSPAGEPEGTSGHYLSFTLSSKEGEKASIETELTFKLPEGMDSLDIDVEEDDIHLRNVEYASEDTTGEPSFDLTADDLTLNSAKPEFSLDTDSLETSKEIDQNATTLAVTFPFTATVPEGSASYIFQLTLPKGIQLPDGELSASGLSIQAGEDTKVAEVTGLSNATISDSAFANQTLSFTLTIDKEGESTLEQIVDVLSDGGAEVTFSNLQVSFNDLFSAGNDTDIQLTVTQEPTEEGEVTGTVENSPISIQLTAPQGEAAYEQGELTPVTQSVTWLDNNNAEGRRPAYGAGAFYPTIKYIITNEDNSADTESGTLNQSTLAELGFTTWPEIKPTNTGFSFNLPETLTVTDPYGKTTYTIDWTFEAPAVEGYSLKVGEGENPTWTYTLTEDFTFTLAMKRGYPEGFLSNDQVMALLRQFAFRGQTNVTGQTSEPFALLEEDLAKLTIESAGDDTYTITIPGLAAYDADNAPLVYWVTEKAESTAPDKVTYEELTECQDTLLPEGKGENGDYYKIAYDNAGVADAGSSTTATYSGGKLTLTLTGVTQYQATKIWLDSGDTETRPKAEFELWRYTGTAPGTAAQLRWKDVVENGDDNFIVIEGTDLSLVSEETTEPDTGDEGITDNDTPTTLDGETVTDPSESGEETTTPEETPEPEITAQSEYRIEFKHDGNPLDLPKYDPDGKRYTYGVREYLTQEAGDNHYEQVFGQVDPETGEVEEGSDILPYGGARANDTLVYNEGILSNRVTNTATASVTKIWEAAAYQAAFEDVAVEFTLYVRVKPEEGTDTSADANWKEYQENGNAVTCVLHNFSAESMTDSTSQGGLDLYDATGQELEYRWVETAVYQGVEDDNLSNEKRIEISTENLSQASFTLTQTAADGKTPKDVVYQSETEYRANQTTVTNSVEDTVDFALAKEWANSMEEDEKFDVTFHIYQALAGNDFNFEEPYVSVTIPVDEDEAPYLVDKDGSRTDTPHEDGVALTSDTEDIAQFNTDNTPITPEGFTDWDAIVQNLPLYDETGHLYNYFVLEAASADEKGVVSPSYERGYYPATGDYSCVITNGPGEQVVLMVQKNWIDDGDALHREPVTVGVYYADDSGNLVALEKDGEAVTHEINNNTGSWTDFIYIPDELLKEKGLEAEDLYIVEQTVGEDAKVTHGTSGVPTVAEWEKGYTGTADTDTSIFQVSTDNHRYQVTYKRLTDGSAVPANVAALYVVTNRRLGTVDMTVNKTWVSGGQEDANEGLKILTEALDAVNNANEKDLALAFQLQFASGKKADWNITTDGGTSGDTVSVGGEQTENVPILDSEGNAAASIQVILGPDGAKETNFSFYNLPKYDEQGAVVAYTVEEVWVSRTGDGNWEELDNGLDDSSIESLANLENLQTIWSEYRAAITDQNYTVGSHDVNPGGNAPADDSADDVQTILNTNPADTRRDQDKQHITYTNTRAQTKEVVWYKEWRDNFADQQGNRPDLYLDIYRVVHEDGQEKIELVKKDYRWQVVTPGTTQESDAKIDDSTDVVVGANDANDVWSVTLRGVEKYDDEGYEIQYFAVERTAVRISDFDYQAAQYAYSETGHATDIIGDRDNGADDVTLDLDGDIAWKNSADKPGNIGPFQGSGGGSIAYPQYALLENGTFINTLANSFSVTGMKRWESLPSGYLSSDPDLPTVTFHVYRSTNAVNIPTDGDPVASLTIESSDWASMAKSGSSYSFRIDYEGENVVSVNEKGVVSFVPADENGNPLEADADGSYDRDKLPLYDENGNRYYYKATEAMAFITPDTTETGEDGTVTQATTDTPEVGQVYDVKQDMAGNFTFVNTYDPDVGGLKVKKILSLPADTTADNGGFPTVSFTLKRTYTTSDGTEVEEPVSVKNSELTWTSGDVKEAFDNVEGTDSVLLEHVFEVTGLPIYAPNGSKYVYSIQENTGKLGGYLTYAKTGDVEVENVDSAFTEETQGAEIKDLRPQEVTTTTEGDEATPTELDVQATFYNVWGENQGTVTLTGTKAWQDYGDAMGTRPELPTTTVTEEGKDPLGLVVKRTAGDSTEMLELGKDYTVTYTEGENNTWTFKIKGIGNGELEKYATQGVAWTYTVTETLDDNEDMSGYQKASGAWSAKADKEPGEDGSIALGSLTNSLYTNVSFDKVWADQDGKEITSKYIDFDVEVTFQLQVKAGEDAAWVDAGKYFDQALGDKAGTIDNTVAVNGWEEGADYTATKTGKVHDQNWSGSFRNLPKVIRAEDGNLVDLDYRVVETKVAYDGGEQTFELNGNQYAITDPGLVTGAAFTSSGNVTTNTLSAISVTVAKEWMDNKNQYDTRPNSQGSSMTWESWFVLQRTTDGETWENVKLVNLYGTDRANGEGAGTGEKWRETISGLPTMDFASGEEYTYRFQELKPKRVDGKVVGYADTDLNDDLSDYLVGNGETYFEAGNEDSFDYKAEYSTDGGSVENKQTVTVTNSLLTRADTVTVEKVWYDEDGTEEAPEGASVTMELQQQVGKDGQWTAYQTVTLPHDGSWNYTWEDLPEKQNGENVSYRVEEISHTPEEYINIHKDIIVDEDAPAVTYTFTNVAPTEFTVEKEWVGTDDPTGEITVGLYRTTEESKVGNADDSLKVPGEDGTTQQTADLNAGNDWTAEFTGLPKYNEDGDLYHYYALEMSGGEPVAQQGTLNHDGQDYAVDYAFGETTTIRNIPTTDLTGTKTWVDNGNAYNTRPDAEDFQLSLERTTVENPSEENWEKVEDVDFSWSDTEESSNTWTYHFDNLPQYTSNGDKYTYRVTEKTPPNGYAEQNDGAGVSENNNDATNGPAFTNILTGTIEVKGTKTWDDNDNADGTRPDPEDLQLILWQTTAEKPAEEDWTQVDPAAAGGTFTWDIDEEASNEWTYTFGDLPLYDGNGVRYTYRVTEADQDAYDVYYTNGSSNVVRQENLRNVARGELTVTKTVTGNRGSWSQDFDFSVTFSLPEGFQDANGLPQISFEKSDGTMGTLKFEDQSLTYTFELRHGQSITFTDLPGGTSYDVDETNSYGHSQSFTGDVGAIPAGEAVAAAFVNHRSGGSWEPDDPTPEDPDDPEDPTPEEPEDPEDPDEPDDPGIDIPEDPTPGVDVPTDPDDPTPEDPDDPDDPGIDIPDDPSPGTDIPDDPTPGTDTPTKPSTPDKDTPNKLPQTGQLWWPVGLLMAAGAALLAAGVLRIRKHHGRDAQK